MNCNPRHTISLLIAGIILAIGVASCSQDEPPTEPVARPIGIASYMDGTISRATAPMDTDYHMWVSALYHHDNAGFFYLRSSEFVCRPADSIWYNTAGAIYPFEGSLDFVGFASKNPDHKPSVVSTPGHAASGLNDDSFISRLRLSYTGAKNMLDGTDDILASTVVENIDCDGDIAEHSPVNLNFFHLLSCLRLKFTAQTEEASQFVWITGITIMNARFSGSVTMQRERGGNWDINWTSLTNPTTIRRNVNFNPAYGETTPPCVDFFLPPQSTADIKVRVYYKYRVEQEIFTSEAVLRSGKIKNPTSFEIGNRYNISISALLLPHVEFQVSLTDENGMVLEEWVEEPEIIL